MPFRYKMILTYGYYLFKHIKTARTLNDTGDLLLCLAS